MALPDRDRQEAEEFGKYVARRLMDGTLLQKTMRQRCVPEELTPEYWRAIGDGFVRALPARYRVAMPRGADDSEVATLPPEDATAWEAGQAVGEMLWRETEVRGVEERQTMRRFMQSACVSYLTGDPEVRAALSGLEFVALTGFRHGIGPI